MLDLKGCGPFGFLLVFLGVAGFGASVFTLLLAWTRHDLAARLAPLTIVIGAAAIATGLFATDHIRRIVDDAISSGRAAAGDEERMRGLGYAEARTCTLAGVQSGAMPLAAGALALVVALARRSRNAPRES